MPLKALTEDFPVPWGEVIEAVLIRKFKLPETPNEGQLALIWLRTQAWEIALYWLIKWEWRGAQWNLPVPYKTAQACKAKGRFLQQIFRLCERCHTFQDAVPEVSIPYRHAAYWFGMVYWESVLNEISTTFYTTELKSKDRTKKALLSARTNECRALANSSIPFKENPNLEAINKLMLIAIRLADLSPSFNEEYWQPFLKAYQEETKSMSGEKYKSVVLEDGKLYAVLGGRQRRKITAPKNFIYAIR